MRRGARRLALAALLGVALLGCDDGAEPPPGDAPASPGTPLPPAAPDTAVTAEAATAPEGEGVDTGAVVIRHRDDAPPAPVPIRAAVGSCDARAVEPLCFDFSGTGWTAAAAQAECARTEGGVFQSAACPTAERIGACVYRPDGDAAREIVYTFYAPMEPLIAEAVCRGTFRAF